MYKYKFLNEEVGAGRVGDPVEKGVLNIDPGVLGADLEGPKI